MHKSLTAADSECNRHRTSGSSLTLKAGRRLIHASDDLRAAAARCTKPLHQRRLRELADRTEQTAEMFGRIARQLRGLTA